MLAKRKKMSRDNPRAVKTTDAHAEYIALDDQPLAVVDDLELRFLAMPYHRHGLIDMKQNASTTCCVLLQRSTATTAMAQCLWSARDIGTVYTVELHYICDGGVNCNGVTTLYW